MRTKSLKTAVRVSHAPSLDLFFCLPATVSVCHLIQSVSHVSISTWTFPLNSELPYPAPDLGPPTWISSRHLGISHFVCLYVQNWFPDLCLNLLIPQFPYFIKWQLSFSTCLGQKLLSYPKFSFSHTFHVWFLRTFCASTFKIYSESTNLLPSLRLPSWINPISII